MAENQRSVAMENNRMVATLKTSFTVEEAEAELKSLEQRKKSAEEYMKQFKPILQTPDFKKWKEQKALYEREEFQKKMKGSEDPAMNSAKSDIEMMDKAIAEIKGCLATAVKVGDKNESVKTN